MNLLVRVVEWSAVNAREGRRAGKWEWKERGGIADVSGSCKL